MKKDAMKDVYQLIDNSIKMYEKHAYLDGLIDMLQELINDEELKAENNYYKVSKKIIDAYYKLKDKKTK